MRFLKILAWINGLSLLSVMMSIDSLHGWVPYLILMLNLGYLVIYSNIIERRKKHD